MSSTAPSRHLVLTALIAVQVLFGINYVVSKIVVGVFPPLLWASARIIVSSVFMLGLTLLAKRKHPTGGAQFFIPLIGYALLGVIINQSSFLVGLRYTSSTNSAILNTLIPVFTLLIVTLRGQETLTLRKGVGFTLSLVGVLALRKVENFSFSDQTMMGDLLTILNCLSYGLFLSFSKKFISTHDSLWTSTWLFLYGSVGLTALALPDWSHFQMPAITPALWAAMAFAIIGATFLTYFLNLWALAYAKPSQVALFIYLQPVVASFIAWSFMGEAITTRTLFSGFLIFAGLLLALGVQKHGQRQHCEQPAR